MAEKDKICMPDVTPGISVYDVDKGDQSEVVNSKLEDLRAPADKKKEIAHKLNDLMSRLKKGVLPPMEDIHATIALASRALQSSDSATRVQQSEERFGSVCSAKTRHWLATTFTNSEAMSEPCYRPKTPIMMFRAAANSIIISNFMKTFTSGQSQDMAMPSEAKRYLQDLINSWSFNIFKFKMLCKRSPLKLIGYHLFQQHNLFHKYKIPLNVFDNYMTRVEFYYDRHSNPYHNSTHGADVAQTLNCLLTNTGVIDVVTDVEKLASILAALVHDVDHPGRNNQFLVKQRSEWAILYHDKSVLENHHLKIAFDLIQCESTNFLVNISAEDYTNFRALVIDMVLATDMAHHFNMLRNVTAILASREEGGVVLFNKERHTVFQCLLHVADIAHPGKPWDVHTSWTNRVVEEFYQQGDEESKLNMIVSPLCDRACHDNMISSQIYFLDIIVAPMFAVAGDMIDLLLQTAEQQKLIDSVGSCDRVWDTCQQENVAQWRELERREKQAEQANKDSQVDEPAADILVNPMKKVCAQPQSLPGKDEERKEDDKDKPRPVQHYQTVPKITLNPIKPAKHFHRSGTFPVHIVAPSVYDSSDDSDAMPETPNSLGVTSDSSLSSPDDAPLPRANSRHPLGKITFVVPCQPSLPHSQS